MESDIIRARSGITEPVVALTFDDGPSPWTDPIADELDRHDAHGTFFVIGDEIDSAERRATVRRLASGRHDVGNHTSTHPDLQTLTAVEVQDEMRRATETIADVLGEAPRYWRAPFFRSDARVRDAVGDLAGREVWYSSMPGDWELAAAVTAARVLEDLAPGDIVVLHDGRPANEPAELSAPTREETVLAVGLILDEMALRGLRSVSISELLAAR